MVILNSNLVTFITIRKIFQGTVFSISAKGIFLIRTIKKKYHGGYYKLGQVIECLNPPKNIENYVCKGRQVKMHRPRYDPVSENFLGLYETVGYISVMGDF